MSFVYDNSVLPFPKTDLVPIPEGADKTKFVQASDWNAVCQAITDLRTAIINGALVHRWVGGRESHASDVPLSVGAIALDSADFEELSAVELVVIGGIGNTVNGTVELYNLTDGISVATVPLSTTAISKGTASITLGSGEKIYECRIYLDSAAVDNDSVELYQAYIVGVP